MNQMDINEMARRDFQSLPRREWDQEIGVFDSLVIMPLEISWWGMLKYSIIEWLRGRLMWFESYYYPRGLHDSGYRCMDFVACKGNKPICRLSGCSDVIHINGIGGHGRDWLQRYSGVPDSIKPISWSMDCLKGSGYLRLFCREQLECGPALSSFEVYIKEPETERQP